MTARSGRGDVGRRLTAGSVASRWVLASIFGGGVIALLLALIGAPSPVPVDAGLLAHLTGLLAGYLVAVMVMMMSRAPFLENHVGPDRLARWHARGGRIFLVLVLLHAGAAVQAWAGSRQQSLPVALFAVLGLPGLLTATIGTALFLVIAVVSIRRARRRLSYERWHGIHLLTYVAIALSFAHELAGPNLAGHRVVQVVWSLAYAYAFALLLRYRFLGPLAMLWRHRLRVETVVPEADGVVSIIMRGRHLAELRAEPGQFFRWRFLTPATFHLALPFSLSAPPRGNFLRITVKAVGTGSRRVHRLCPGTLVLAEGPSGAMTAHRRTRPSVLLFAGGVGITPMRALFEDAGAPWWPTHAVVSSVSAAGRGVPVRVGEPGAVSGSRNHLADRALVRAGEPALGHQPAPPGPGRVRPGCVPVCVARSGRGVPGRAGRSRRQPPAGSRGGVLVLKAGRRFRSSAQRAPEFTTR